MGRYYSVDHTNGVPSVGQLIKQLLFIGLKRFGDIYAIQGWSQIRDYSKYRLHLCDWLTEKSPG